MPSLARSVRLPLATLLLLLAACSAGEPSSSDDPDGGGDGGGGGGGGGGGTDAAIFSDGGSYQNSFASSGEMEAFVQSAQMMGVGDQLQYWMASPRGLAQRIVDLHGGRSLIDPVNSSPGAPLASCALTYTGLDSVLQPIDADANGYYDNVAVIFPANCRRTPGGGYIQRTTGTIRFKQLSGNAGYVVLIDLPTYTTDSTHHTGGFWMRDTVRIRGDSIQWSRASRDDYFPTTPENGQARRLISLFTGVFTGGALPSQSFSFSPGTVHRGSYRSFSRDPTSAEPGIHLFERIMTPLTYAPCDGGIPLMIGGIVRITGAADTTKGMYAQATESPCGGQTLSPFGFDSPPT